MEFNSKYRIITCQLFLLLMLLLLSGCIYDDLSKCFRGRVLSLNVTLPGDIPGSALQNISLYVFDENDLLLDILAVDVSEPVELNYPGVTGLHCVAWCNVGGGEVTMSPLEKGDTFSQGMVSLKRLTDVRSGGTLYRSPSDLFSGRLKLAVGASSGGEGSYRLYVGRMVASMNVTIRGLQGLSGSSGGDYSLVVRETTGSIDFGGIYGGDRASYSVRGSMNGRKEYVVPSFRLFPVFEGEGLIIDIYRDGSLLRSVTLEDDGSPIVPEVGTTLNVLLNFEGHVSVSVAVTKWNVVHIWKEYD